MPRHRLRSLLSPSSIALVGANERAGSIGRIVLDNLLAGGFKGPVELVNPKYPTVLGRRCVPSARDLPAPVDLAVIVAPAPAVPGIVADCGARGITSAVVLSAGFAETGPEGAALARQMVANARAGGVRLLGPNSVGLLRPGIGLNASFARGQANPGRVALVSQSGGILTTMIDWAADAGIGFSSLVSLGSAADLDFGDLLDFFLFDGNTDSVLMYIEGVRDARRFMSSVRALARSKPVVVMKAGRREHGARAVASHSGALTGNDRVFEAAISRAGAVRVQTSTQLLSSTRLLNSIRRPAGNRLAIVTNGGGPGVIAADAADARKIHIPDLAPETIARLDAVLPAHWSRGNPIDVIGDADAERIRAAVEAAVADPNVDAVLSLFVPTAVTTGEEAAQAIRDAAAGANKTVVAVLAGEAAARPGRRLLDEAGIPQFRAPENAVDAIGLLDAFHRNTRKLREIPSADEDGFAPDLLRARAIGVGAIGAGRTLLNELESKALLQVFGLQSPPSRVARTPEEAGQAADTVGYPCVLKIFSPDIVHKSDVGGVRINIASRTAAEAAARDILESVARMRPDARVTGVLVQPMVRIRDQRELYLGMNTDPVFGAVIAFGAGGIAVERIDDIAIGLPPLNRSLARMVIEKPRIARLLAPYRNVPGIDLASLDVALTRFSTLVCECPWIRAIDINPLVAHEHGVLVLDARIELHDTQALEGIAARPRYAHLAIHPYPRELERPAIVKGGVQVLIRPIRPDDAERDRRFFARLSPDTVYRRFMMSLRELPPQLIERFTQIDYDRELALVAIDSRSGEDEIVGVSRITPTADATLGEFAIVIDDTWQRTGLGRVLMKRLFDAARERHYRCLEGYVLAENTTMLRFCESLGMVIRANPEDAHEKIARLEL